VLLSETIGKSGWQIPASHLVNSLDEVIKTLLPRHPNHNWAPAFADLQSAQAALDGRRDSEVRQSAASLVNALPKDAAEPGTIAGELFDITLPQLRVGLRMVLWIAYLLVGLPIVTRAAIEVFPLLERSPSQW
jgi:hypothetical protein